MDVQLCLPHYKKERRQCTEWWPCLFRLHMWGFDEIDTHIGCCCLSFICHPSSFVLPPASSDHFPVSLVIDEHLVHAMVITSKHQMLQVYGQNKWSRRNLDRISATFCAKHFKKECSTWHALLVCKRTQGMIKMGSKRRKGKGKQNLYLRQTKL